MRRLFCGYLTFVALSIPEVALNQEIRAFGDVEAVLVVREAAEKCANFRFLVGIRNVSRRPLHFAFADPPPNWLYLYDFIARRAEGQPSELSGVSPGSKSRRWTPGVEVCHPPGSVFMLQPGAELFRDVEIEMNMAPVGRVSLTVAFEIVEVTPSIRCQVPRPRRVYATSDIVVLPARPARTERTTP